LIWLSRPTLIHHIPLLGLVIGLWLPMLGIALVLFFLALAKRAWVGAVLMLVMLMFGIGKLNLLPLTAQSEVPPDLTVITFNVGARTALTDPNIARLLEYPSDIALLQETFALYQHPDRIPALDHIYPYQQIQRTAARYRGNMTLSAFPMLETYGFEADNFYTRVVLDMDERQLAVYNVSLAVPFDPQSADGIIGLLTGYDTTARDQQIEQLLAILETETLPHIVAGDFNFHDVDPMYDRVIAAMGDTFAQVGVGTGVTWPASSLSGVPEWTPLLLRLDYIFHSDELCPVQAVTLPSTGSDHLPVWAGFVWCES
jgi:vancomycin resistance protein VanJ